MHHSCTYMRFEPVSISQISSHKWENISCHVRYGNAMEETLVSAGTWDSPHLCPDLWRTAGQKEEEEMSSLMPQKEENSIWYFLFSGVDITPSVSNSTKLMAPQGFSILWEAVTSHCVFDRSLLSLLKTEIPGLCRTQTTGEHHSYHWEDLLPLAFLSQSGSQCLSKHCWRHILLTPLLISVCFSLSSPGYTKSLTLSPEHALHLGKLPLLFQLVDCHKVLPSPRSSQKKHPVLLIFNKNIYEFFILGVHASEAHLQSCCNSTVVTWMYITAWLSWWTITAILRECSNSLTLLEEQTNSSLCTEQAWRDTECRLLHPLGPGEGTSDKRIYLSWFSWLMCHVLRRSLLPGRVLPTSKADMMSHQVLGPSQAYFHPVSKFRFSLAFPGSLNSLRHVSPHHLFGNKWIGVGVQSDTQAGSETEAGGSDLPAGWGSGPCRQMVALGGSCSPAQTSQVGTGQPQPTHLSVREKWM